MPASAAKIVQFSTPEATWGTSGATAGRKLHGVTDATLKINSTVEVVPSLGWFGPSAIAQEQSHSGEGKMDMVATYEEAPGILNMFFTGMTTASNSSAPYTYAWAAPVTSTQACFTFSIGMGTSTAVGAYNAVGAIGKHLNIKGEAGGFWTMTCDFIAKSIQPNTGTMSAGTDRTVNPVRMGDTTLYIDTFTSTSVGTTAVTATLISFELDMETNRHLKQFAGSISPASWGDGKYEGSMKLTAEFNTSAKALVDGLLGATGAAVQRLISIGAANGSSASAKTFDIDFAGIKSEGETLWSDRDGNMTVDLTFQGQYSTGLANWLAFAITNGSSSTT